MPIAHVTKTAFERIGECLSVKTLLEKERQSMRSDL